MIHELSTPALLAFDLRVDHYDWALWLAQAGLDVFMLDFQGSGQSPLPDRNTGVMKDTVSRISESVPVLIIVGTLDRQVEVFPKFPNSFFNLYETIPHNHKLLFRVDCAGHMMNWERQRRVLHHISKEWLNHGAVEGFTNGRFFVDREGVIHPQL